MLYRIEILHKNNIINQLISIWQLMRPIAILMILISNSINTKNFLWGISFSWDRV